MKKIFLILLFFIFLSSPSWATDYFVDPSVGSSGNGLSWSTAWKAVANINWTTLNTGTNTLYFCGGHTYTTMTIYHTGTGILTLRPGSYYAADPHNGLVTFSGNIALGDSDEYPKNLTISGETTIGSGTRNILLRSIQNGYYLQGTWEDVACKILYCEISNGSGAEGYDCLIMTTPDTYGWEIAYNYLHDTGGGAVWLNNVVYHTFVETDFGQSSMHHNIIKNTRGDGFEGYYGGWDFYNNTFWGNSDLYGGDPYVYGDGISSCLNSHVRIFNNEIWDYGQGIFISHFGNNIKYLYIYNNVFYWTGKAFTTPAIIMRGITNAITADSVRIVNNTFDVNGDVGAIVFSMSTDDYKMTMTNWVIANNIFCETTSQNFSFAERSGQAHVYSNSDLKFYKNVFEDTTIKSYWHTTEKTSITDWNADAATGATTAGYSNKTGTVSFTNQGAYDYSLQSGDTVAKWQGMDLATIFGWTDMGLGWGKDINGTTRPVGSAWSIGAYDYAAGSGASFSVTPGKGSGQITPGKGKFDIPYRDEYLLYRLMEMESPSRYDN